MQQWANNRSYERRRRPRVDGRCRVVVAGAGAHGPAQLVLTASVARRYYLDGRSKVEIAEEFALSRFKVARILEDARQIGVVRIEIGVPGTIDVELSERLMDALGLTHC